MSEAPRLPVEGTRWSVNLVAQAGSAMWPQDEAGAVGVLEAILVVARALRLRTVAEGVAPVAQYRLLTSQGCREGQGYLFARPLEAPAFASLLAAPSSPCRPELLSGTG